MNSAFLPWSIKHSPATLAEVAGNDDAKTEIKRWALDVERGTKAKPLLLYGPPGVGKTASALALAREMNWTLFETNASDARDAKTVAKLFTLTSSSRGLYGEKRLILLDEIDGAFDRGEVPELIKLLKDSSQPLILTANDMWNKNLANVRQLVKPIEFKRVNARSTVEVLQRIATAENLQIERTALDAIAKNAGGDVRSAINDLQAGSTSQRDVAVNVFDAVRTVLKSRSYDRAVASSENLDLDLDNFVTWIDENIPHEFEKAEDRAKGFSWLSKADIMKARIRKKQYYKLLRYVRAYSHAGVSLANTSDQRKFTPYQFPQLIRLLGASKAKRELYKSACRKVGTKMHCSTAIASTALPFLAGVDLSYFSLDEEEKNLVQTRYGIATSVNGKAKTAAKTRKVKIK